MITIAQVVTKLGKKQYKGKLLDTIKIEWLFDGHPVVIQMATPEYFVGGKDIEIWIMQEPQEKQLFCGPRLKIMSKTGHSIDSVSLVTSTSSVLGGETVTEVKEFDLDETKSTVDLFGIRRDVHDEQGKFLWGEQISLRTYLEEKNETTVISN